MEHPPTSSSLEDSARKFRLALAAVTDGARHSVDPRIADALGCAADVITQAREMIDARDTIIARLRIDDVATGQTARFQDAALESLHKRLDEANAALANLQASLNEMHIRAVDAESGYPCIADRDATIAKLKEQKASIISSLTAAVDEIADRKADSARLQEALDTASNDRASIVAFLTAEAKRFDRAADDFDEMDKADSADRCRTKAGHTRTLAAQIERGDDRKGGQ